MKTRNLLFLLVLLSWLGIGAAYGQTPRGGEDDQDTSGVSSTLLMGGISIDGKNYQQIGMRTDIPLGKFGFGVDIQILMDGEGKIRKEDWDEWTDYLDKIYYMRYGQRNSPFYVKVGGLDYSYLGYRNIINGYSNMVEYPAVKRYGMELAINADKFDVELLLNDFKEVFDDEPSMVFGARAAYKPIGKLEIGASVGGDLNEYNGLKDLDNDGYPDPIDMFPEDKDLVTEYDHYVRQAYAQIQDSTIAQNFAQDAIDYGVIDDTKAEDLFNLKNNRSSSLIYSLDIGYPLIDRDNFGFTLFSHFTQIQDYGWGISAPGAIFNIGKFLTLTAEYRKQSEEFLFGYFNNTYELERAKFVEGPTGLRPVTKQETLEDITEPLNGYFAGVNINLFGLATVDMKYEDLRSNEIDLEDRSVYGSLNLSDKLLPVIHEAGAFYVQNHVQNFKEWKTPSTIMGYVMSYDFNGTVVGLEYRYTFRDVDGNGVINGDKETIKTFGFSTKMTF